MTRRRWWAIPSAIAALALTTACGSVASLTESPTAIEPSPSAATIEILDAAMGEEWQVAVLHPSPLPPDACAEDAAVDSSVMTADMPASRVGYTLASGSTESDAMRVAECIQQGVDSGEITITPPAVG